METNKQDKNEKSGSIIYNPYVIEINEARLNIDKACNEKNYQKIDEELGHLHTYFLNTQIQYSHFISGLEKDLQNEKISNEAKSMMEKLLEDLKSDEEKISKCVSEIIKQQREYDFIGRQTAKMKLQLLMISLTNPHILN
jgi:hypothetical protein